MTLFKNDSKLFSIKTGSIWLNSFLSFFKLNTNTTRTWSFSDSNESSLLNCVGCVETWVTWVAWIALVKLLRGSTCYVGHNFYVGCVGQIYFCVGQNFLRGSIFLRGSTFFAWVKNLCEGLSFPVVNFFLW